MIHLRRDRSSYDPTVFSRWGFVLFSITILMIQGCGSAPRHDFSAGNFSVQQDSLGLDAFFALSLEVQDLRRDLAASLINQANAASRSATRLRTLKRAAGLAPDNPNTWISLAQDSRWLGNYVTTSSWLESAAAAVRRLPKDVDPQVKREAQRQTALARSWLHYDRAEYREAMRWVRAGQQASVGDIHIRRIRGLIEGSLNHRSLAHEIAGDILRNDPSDPDANWVLATLDRAQGKYREAFNFISDLRPDHPHSAECFRDKGEIAEHLGEWGYARRWYAESASSLPVAHHSELLEIMYHRLQPGVSASDQPVWLADGRYYVTGSLSAYCALALDRFDEVEDPAEKEFWAGQVVDASGILLRKEMHRGWSLRARGLVFGAKNMANRAKRDLKQAATLLRDEGVVDARIEAMVGHLYLVEKNHEEALAPLRLAVILDAENALAWSDLGLCYIMAGDRQMADESLTRAIELDPELATSWYNRGLMNLHAGDLDQAEKDLQQAARLAPGNTEVGKLLQQVNLRKKSQ